MSNFDRWTTIVLLSISAAVWVALLAVYIIRRMIDVSPKGPCKKLGISRMLLFSGCLLVSTWCLRYAVGYYAVLFPEDGVAPLHWWEEIFNSFVHALQTFSMDEEYTDYIRTGKEMMAVAFNGNEFWQQAYGVYASVLNVAAPIAGGAIVLEVLARIFPEIQLWLSYFSFWRKKYFFSELNPESLALAKSICTEKRSEHPMVIFTDTYVDDEKETEYELFLEAKRYGAICVRKDLSHVTKPLCGKREFYLMDEEEFSNLQTLMGLIEDRNLRHIKDSCIYLFVQTDAYVQIEKQAKQRLEAKKALLKGGGRPVIVPVRGYRNLVQNLFIKVPLYEPLVDKQDKTHLNVTILGNGVIGTEAFLNAYWMGQLLVSQGEGEQATMQQCQLSIHVISKDTEEDFWARIDYVNPDIRQTVEIQNKTKEEAPCVAETLLVYPGQTQTNKTYCKVRYTQRDLKSGGFWTDADKNTAHLLESDYYVVALGNDSDNISIAEKLRSYIGKHHLENPDDGQAGNVVIAYAVFDSELSMALNADKYFRSFGHKKPDIYMHAFGNLEQVYSCDNVYMSKNLLWANETGSAYLQGQYENSHRQDNKRRSDDDLDNYENANYNYWASMARALHLKYKLFSLGWIETSVFQCESEQECEAHREKVRATCALYQLFAAAGQAELVLSKAAHRKFTDLERKKECLAWLEHRRWNAFTRIMGYQYVDVDQMLKASGEKGEHKDMRLKLHACLVEAKLPDIEKNEVYMTGENRDMLDKVTFAKRAAMEKQGIKQKDLKAYDYYICEFDNFQFEKTLIKELEEVKVKNPRRYCAYDKFKDSIPCDLTTGREYLVAVEAVKCILGKKYRAVSETDGYKGSFIFRKTCYAPKWSIWLNRREK